MQVTVFQEKILVLLNFGNGPIEIFYSASIHANEWITSVLLIKFIEEYLDTTSEQFAKVKNIANDYPSIPFPERLEGKY